jgi:molybdate transport system substrate-binding protein
VSVAPLRVLSTLAVMGAMQGMTVRIEAVAGRPVQTDFSPTQGLLARIRSGERADLAILTADGVEELASAGVLDPASRVDLVRSHVGIAVQAGAPHPDVGDEAALREALLAAPSIAYSRTGASGIAFAALIGRMGIADAVNAKAQVIPAGFTAELAARGEVALAVQQVSELLAVPGIELVGRLPAGLGPVAVFSAAVFRDSPAADAAARLIRFLRSREAAPALEEAGLEPIGAG